MEISKQQLIEAATKKGYRTFESNGMIGFCKKFRYHWFTNYGIEEGGWIFNHTYSQNTGKTFKGSSHRFRVYESLGL